MNPVKQKLTEFFDQYEARMNKAVADKPIVDVEATASAFADYFVEASPVGVNGGKNDAAFRKMIPAGFEFYQSIGTKSMTTTGREITQIDELHWMVTVHWRARYEKKIDGTQDVIDFDVFYFVQILDDTPKIFAYITGDEQKVLKEHGLIPNVVPEEVPAA